MTPAEQEQAEQIIRDLCGLSADVKLTPRVYVKYLLQYEPEDDKPWPTGAYQDDLLEMYITAFGDKL